MYKHIKTSDKKGQDTVRKILLNENSDISVFLPGTVTGGRLDLRRLPILFGIVFVVLAVSYIILSVLTSIYHYSDNNVRVVWNFLFRNMIYVWIITIIIVITGIFFVVGFFWKYISLGLSWLVFIVLIIEVNFLFLYVVSISRPGWVFAIAWSNFIWYIILLIIFTLVFMYFGKSIEMESILKFKVLISVALYISVIVQGISWTASHLIANIVEPYIVGVVIGIIIIMNMIVEFSLIFMTPIEKIDNRFILTEVFNLTMLFWSLHFMITIKLSIPVITGSYKVGWTSITTSSKMKSTAQEKKSMDIGETESEDE